MPRGEDLWLTALKVSRISMIWNMMSNGRAVVSGPLVSASGVSPKSVNLALVPCTCCCTQSDAGYCLIHQNF